MGDRLFITTNPSTYLVRESLQGKALFRLTSDLLDGRISEFIGLTNVQEPTPPASIRLQPIPP